METEKLALGAIKEVASDICDNYCKWPETIEPDKEEELYKICDECPFDRLYKIQRGLTK